VIVAPARPRRLDHDLVGAVDPLDRWRTISERRIDAGLPQ
jgi:hypothetical protein